MAHAAVEQATSPVGRVGATARSLQFVLHALAVAMAATPFLGPLGLGLMEYRTSPTTLNQLLGSDAAMLFVGAPIVLVAAALFRRGHPAAPFLTVGVAGYVLYTYAQVIIGQEYLRLPGNVERFFPLLLGVFILAEAALVMAWRAMPPQPQLSHGVRRMSGLVLIAVAAFLVLGLHLRSVVIAWSDPDRLVEYVSSPTPFWLVKLMDLGIVVPVALATGVGLLRGASWANRAAYVVLTGYTCLAISVATMGLIMYDNGDPGASLSLTTGLIGFAAVLVVLTLNLYRPLLGGSVNEGGTTRTIGGPGEVEPERDQLERGPDPATTLDEIGG